MSKIVKNSVTDSPIRNLIPPRVAAGVMLPSKGKFYDPALTVDGQVEVFPLIGRDEKLLAGMSGDINFLIDSLLKRCLKTDIPHDELLPSDRFFLLLALRANSYGEDYNVKITCDNQKCQEEHPYTIKLMTDLKVRYTEDSDTEPFVCKLPVSEALIEFRLLKRKDEKAIEKMIAEDRAKGIIDKGDPSVIYTLAKQIISINKEKVTGTNFLDVLYFLENMPIKDMRFLQNRIDEVTPGVIPIVTKECKGCGSEIVVGLPITAEFFRPEL